MNIWLLVVLAACGGPQQVVEPSSAVKLEWRAAQGEGQNVDVTLVVNGQELALGSLEATSDCTLRKAEATATEFSCGGASSYNYFLAELKSGQVIVSLVNGLVGDP